MNDENGNVNKESSVYYRKRATLTEWMPIISFEFPQIGWCICVEQKYEKIYYILRFNIKIRDKD